MTEANILIEDIASTDTTKIIKVIAISGQLDESNIDEKSQVVYQLITQNPKGLNLIFDFEKLEYMNSKSIGYLTDWYGKITESAGQIMIIKAKPNIIDILQVIGLTQLITIYGSLDEAKFAILNTTATPVIPQAVISTNIPTVTNVITPAVPAQAVPVAAIVAPITAEAAPIAAATQMTPAPAVEPTVTPVTPVATTPIAPSQS